MKIIFDQNTPKGLASRLVGHHVSVPRQLGWERIVNGLLLATAETAGFELLLTCDTNIKYQQNLTGRRIAIVQLTTNHWRSIRACCADILAAVNKAQPGSYQTVAIPQLPFERRRRRNAS